jgi:hypothetical protein
MDDSNVLIDRMFQEAAEHCNWATPGAVHHRACFPPSLATLAYESISAMHDTFVGQECLVCVAVASQA